MSANLLKHVLILCVSISVFVSSAYAQPCESYIFSNNETYRACNDLPYLNSSLHYNYNSSSKTMQIAYRHTNITSTRWVAWAVNPMLSGMVGSQAFVAYQQSNGSLKVYTSPITNYAITTLKEGDLNFDVIDLSATYSSNEMIIFATFAMWNNKTTLNQVWQEGPVLQDVPGAHSLSQSNILSKGTINILSGDDVDSGPLPTSAIAPMGGGGNSRGRKVDVNIFYLIFLFFIKYTI